MKCGEANFDPEVEGEHPKVYCRFGCGCWVYASPSPTHDPCTLCNSHPSINCKTFICALSDCRSATELRKAVRNEPSEIERLPERTPEQEKKLFEMLSLDIEKMLTLYGRLEQPRKTWIKK